MDPWHIVRFIARSEIAIAIAIAIAAGFIAIAFRIWGDPLKAITLR